MDNIKVLLSEIEDSKYYIYILTFSFVFLITFLSIKFPIILLKNFLLIIFFYILSIIFIFIGDYYKIINNLDKNLVFFIVFLYSISFITTNLDKFFETASQETSLFKYHSYFMKKIYILKKKYRFTYPEAIRQILNIVPKSSFKNFLERLATSIETGEELSKFLDREYKSKFDEYDTNYKKGFESIKILQELIVSLLTTIAFIFAYLIIIPYIISINISDIILVLVVSFLGLNFLLYISSKYMILDDPLWINGNEKPNEYIRIKKLSIPFFILSIFIFLFILKLNIPILVASSFAIIPLLYISYRINILEKNLIKKEGKFVGFFSSLLQLSDIFGSNQLKILAMIRNHDFSLLNNDVEILYRRIKITRNYKISWKLFLKELGSNLAYKTINIFQKLLEYGGETKEAGEKLYEILVKVLDLRMIRYQFSSSSTGILYGIYIGLLISLFVTVNIMLLIQQMFTGFSSLLNGSFGSIIGLNLFNANLPIQLFNILAQIFAILEAVFISLIIKNLDGKSKLGMFIHLAILLWIGSLTYIGVSYGFSYLASHLKV